MAWTGTATVVQISDSICRITGLSLASGASGTISLADGTGDVKLPASFIANEYKYAGATITLAQSVDVTTENAATGVATAIPLAIVKTGTVPADFLATFTNTHGSLACPNQEIYVKYHG